MTELVSFLSTVKTNNTRLDGAKRSAFNSPHRGLIIRDHVIRITRASLLDLSPEFLLFYSTIDIPRHPREDDESHKRGIKPADLLKPSQLHSLFVFFAIFAGISFTGLLDIPLLASAGLEARIFCSAPDLIPLLRDESDKYTVLTDRQVVTISLVIPRDESPEVFIPFAPPALAALAAPPAPATSAASPATPALPAAGAGAVEESYILTSLHFPSSMPRLPILRNTA
ncbi:hypothetical protein IW262DRAFT_1467450 [Armillaria fumosa]|nr:hypothetical protein IW262DRAFT_1467450 [Armillaria fumosa]